MIHALFQLLQYCFPITSQPSSQIGSPHTNREWQGYCSVELAPTSAPVVSCQAFMRQSQHNRYSGTSELGLKIIQWQYVLFTIKQYVTFLSWKKEKEDRKRRKMIIHMFPFTLRNMMNTKYRKIWEEEVNKIALLLLPCVTEQKVKPWQKKDQ